MGTVKKLALFDIDGVIYSGHTIFDQIQNQEKRGILLSGTWDKILSEIGEYKSGRKNYKQAADCMLKISALAIKGKSYKEMLSDTTHYMMRSKDKFFPYFVKLIPELKKTYDIFFVTTNFQFICEAIGTVLGVKNYLSSVAEVKNGKFTGKVKLSLAGNKGMVKDLIVKYGKAGSIAVGDSENDADMLKEVEHPFVFEPNEKLEKICKDSGWQVVNRDSAYKALANLL
jgi:phosphoserine phosphatase